MPENKNHVQLQRSLGLYSALSLVIGTIIGSGIFLNNLPFWLMLILRPWRSLRGLSVVSLH